MLRTSRQVASTEEDRRLIQHRRQEIKGRRHFNGCWANSVINIHIGTQQFPGLIVVKVSNRKKVIFADICVPSPSFDHGRYLRAYEVALQEKVKWINRYDTA